MKWLLIAAPIHVVVDSTTDLLWWLEKIFLPLGTAILLFLLGVWATRLTDKIKEYVRLEGVRKFLLTLLNEGLLNQLRRQMDFFVQKVKDFDINENHGGDYIWRASVNLKTVLSIPRSDIYDVFVRYHSGNGLLNERIMISYLSAVDTLSDGLPMRQEMLNQMRQADVATSIELDRFRRDVRDARLRYASQAHPFIGTESTVNDALLEWVAFVEPKRFDEMASYYDQLATICNLGVPKMSEFFRPFILEMMRGAEECVGKANSVIRVRQSVPRVLEENAAMCRWTQRELDRARRHLETQLLPVSLLHRVVRFAAIWVAMILHKFGRSAEANTSSES